MDEECLQSLQEEGSCHAPVKIASYKSAKFSSFFKLEYHVQMDLNLDYLKLHPVIRLEDGHNFENTNLSVKFLPRFDLNEDRCFLVIGARFEGHFDCVIRCLSPVFLEFYPYNKGKIVYVFVCILMRIISS